MGKCEGKEKQKRKEYEGGEEKERHDGDGK